LKRGGQEHGLLVFSRIGYSSKEEERNERKILLMSLFSKMLCNSIRE
jgi:hypothetical protein